MIVAIGVDVIEVSRITTAMENPRFLKRILTLKEREMIKHPARVAGRWAAKEAIAKCLSSLHLKLSWHDIEILNDVSGDDFFAGQRAAAALDQPPMCVGFVSAIHIERQRAGVVEIEHLDADFLQALGRGVG